MCVTGAFVIPLILHSGVRAAVAAQPAVPFSVPYALAGLGIGAWLSELNVSERELLNAQTCVRAESKELMGLRYASDRISPRARLARLQQTFEGHFAWHELGCYRQITLQHGANLLRRTVPMSVASKTTVGNKLTTCYTNLKAPSTELTQ